MNTMAMKGGKFMEVAMYLRKSRAEELNQATQDTVAKHREQLMRFAQQSGLEIVKIYEEVVSGEYLYSRPKMLELLSDVEKGLYGGVLCMDIDRLGRGAMSDMGVILETLKNNHTQIITPRKSYDLTNEFDEEYTEFETFIARRELKIIKRRMQRGLMQSIRRGCYVSNAPYGYEKTTQNKMPTLKIYPAEANFVRFIFHLYTQAGIGCQQIAAYLQLLGAVPRRGGAFSKDSVRKILKNPVYTGKVVWNQRHLEKKGAKEAGAAHVRQNEEKDWLLVKGLHPAIVSQEEFDRAKQIMQSRSNAPRPGRELKNPFAGLILCQNCGRKMQYRNFGEPYLLCPAKGCMPSVKFSLVQNCVLAVLEDWFRAVPIDVKAGRAPGQQSAAQLARQELCAAKKQQGRLLDFLEQGVYSVETYQERSSLLQSKMDSLESFLKDQEKRCPNTKKAPVQSAFDVFCQANPQEQNKILKSVIKQIVYCRDKSGPNGAFDLEITFL